MADPRDHDERRAFEIAARDLVATGTGYAAQITSDSGVRALYRRSLEAMVAELQRDVYAKRLTWRQAAVIANKSRNDIMSMARLATSPVGLNAAKGLKKTGLTLNEAIAKATIKLFGPGAIYDRLSLAQKNQVFAEVVEAAARSNAPVNAKLMQANKVARRVLFLSLAISTYTIMTADDKVAAAKNEAVVTAGGIAGSIAGGALAGLACGPGAPVCVFIGAFVGGAAAAFGADMLW